MRCEEGMSPSPLREGTMPLPWKFFLDLLKLKMASFGAFWELILLQLNCPSYMHKPVSLEYGQ